MERKIGKEVPEAVLENAVWKGTRINFPEGYHRIGKRILAQFRKYPDFIGQIDGASGKKDTYQNMSDRSIRCALWLKKQGIKTGDVVGFCSKSHLNSCIPFYASLFVGAIFNPWWDSSLDEELVIYFFKTTNPKVLFIDEESAEIIMKTLEKNNYALPVIIFGQKTGLISFDDILKAQNDGQVKTFNRSLAHIITHYPTDNTSQIILWFSTLCCISGIMVMLRSIFYKYTMINSHQTSEEDACRFIEKYKVTRIMMGTSFANRFSKRPNVWNYDLSSRSLLMVGGGVPLKEITKFLHKLFKNANIHVLYGTAEFRITVITGPNSPKVIAPKGLISCGRALANVEIKIVDPETKKILGPNEEGELYITEDEIHEAVGKKLHDKMKLRGGVFFLDKMPYTTSKKIAKKELRRMAKALIPEPNYENGIWKGGKVEMPDGYYKIGERILNQFKKYPDFVGQIDGITGRKDTYADMGDRSVRCALWLKKQGISLQEMSLDVLKTQTKEDVEKFECTRVEPKDPVFLIYTSGTLDFPKGVLHSYHSVAHMLRYYPDDGTPTIDLYFSRLCWISGTRTVLRSIIFKATMIVCDNLAEEDACKIIEKYKVTRLLLGTPILNRLTKVKDIEKYDLSSVKQISYGGAAANGQIIKKLPSFFKNADISAHYGSTECGTVIVGSTRFDKFDSCGKVFFNVDIKVIDPDTNKILGPNEKGELCILSPKLMIGYWKNPAKTEKIVDSDGWYHSGDLGYYDEAGVFFIETRIKDSIKCYLFNVKPRTVENVIQGCPGVAEVAVVAKPSFEHCEVPMAFVTKIPGVQKIIEFVEKNLANEVKLLGGVYFLDQMPYTPSKKIAKNRLYAMAKTISEQQTREIPKPVCKDRIWKGFNASLPEGFFRIGEKIYAQFKKFPDFVAQINGASGKKDTYECMGDRSIRCAVWLKKLGVSRGDVVGLCSKNHMNSCIPMIASFYLGAIFNPWWDSCLNEDLVVYFIKTTNPKVLFCDEDNAEMIIKALKTMESSLPVVFFSEKFNMPFQDILKTPSVEEVNKFECTKIEVEDPMIILYTSGTTSYPKGALHTYQSFVSMISYYPPDTTSQIVLWFSGLCWMSGLLTVLRSIITKATMIVYHNLSEEDACRLVEKYKVTRMSMGASTANRFSKTKEAWKYDVSSLKIVSYGGGITTKEVIEALKNLFQNADIYVAYGSTECGAATGGKVNAPKLTSCGKVFFNTEVKVVDPESNRIMGPNEQGELCCRTLELMTRYWNNPTATEEVIDSEGWYHTGDLGYYDEDGDFFIVERLKELIKYRLHHVPPTAIENVIQELPGVAEVAVVAKPSLEDLELPMAFVTRVPGMQVTETEIHEAVEKNLQDKMKLRGGICFLDKMPYTTSKKISKRELRAMAKNLAKKA
ncbi:uncharacterized protein LOC141531830 [Cotesia typhae]|uniref:uncharacterized protein LOC141531830 n=1 Tax=Cotesia typhae TaxID=2053667 RepID=UPI003D69C5E2